MNRTLPRPLIKKHYTLRQRNDRDNPAAKPRGITKGRGLLLIYFLAILLALAPFFSFGMRERANQFTAAISAVFLDE